MRTFPLQILGAPTSLASSKGAFALEQEKGDFALVCVKRAWSVQVDAAQAGHWLHCPRLIAQPHCSKGAIAVKLSGSNALGMAAYFPWHVVFLTHLSYLYYLS